MKFKTGLIFSTFNKPNIERPMSLISSVIRFFTKGKYTHTATAIFIFDKPFVIESDYRGVIPVPFDEWKQNRAWIHVFDPCALETKEEEENFIKKAMSKSGRQYDFKSIWWQLKYQVTGKYEGEEDWDKADDNFICSEYVAWLYNLEGWWKASPINVWKNRFNNFPKGQDVIEGKPDQIIFS